jgi:toxin ParE1/3/4
MPRFKLTDSANRDLREISLYTQKKWGSEQERRYRQQLELELQKLSLNANVGRSREEIGSGVQSFRVAAHIAFYVQRSDGITVLRLLHPHQDVERAFGA